MKILLEIPLSPYSGYGSDGIHLAQALIRWGADVYLSPSVVQAPLPDDVANLLTKTLEAPFDLLINHHDPGQLKLSDERKRAAKTSVAWTMWEWETLEFMPGRSKVKTNLKNFDAVIGYDPVSVGSLKPYVRRNQPLLTLQGGYDPSIWPYAEKRDWNEDRFGFMMVGNLHMRKNPWVSIEAFRQLKEDTEIEFEGAELHLKDVGKNIHPAIMETIPKLRVHYEVWTQEVLYKFFETQHVLLAPSQGEGKNLPALQMLSTGGSVIASDFGGHTMWLNSEYSYPLEGKIVAQDPEYPTAKSFAASVEHMKELMLHAYQNRDEVHRKGDLASQIIPKLCSWDSVVERLFLSLKDTTPDGDQLWMSAQACRLGREDD